MVKVCYYCPVRMVSVKSMNSMTKGSSSNFSPNILESLLNPSYSLMVNPKENNIDELIENKFYCSRRFAEEIESIVGENKGMKYIDAIVFFCEKNNLDVESIPKLVSMPLKEKRNRSDRIEPIEENYKLP